jgi:hypothetical protein
MKDYGKWKIEKGRTGKIVTKIASCLEESRSTMRWGGGENIEILEVVVKA